MMSVVKKILFRVLPLVGVIVLTQACGIYAARFSPPVEQESTVTLRENDFQYLERNLSGAYAYWSLWLGYPGTTLQIPLGDPRLFSNALADLYSKSQKQTEGKSTQMVNWTLDMDEFMLPLFMRHSAVFSADLIEFTKK